MKQFTVKQFEVKDGRMVAKFLVKTGLKKTIFEIMFPKDNPNIPKNWMDMRKHLQANHNMSDEEFKAFKKECGDSLEIAVDNYMSDFPNPNKEIGEMLIDTVIEVFADDVKYEATIDLFAYLFVVERAEIEALSIKETVELVKTLIRDSGFLASLQPSIQASETVTTA